MCSPFEGKPEDDVADLNLFPVMMLSRSTTPTNEARQVVFAIRIEAGHFGSFAANQRAAVVLAGFGNALDDFFGYLRLERCQWRDNP